MQNERRSFKSVENPSPPIIKGRGGRQWKEWRRLRINKSSPQDLRQMARFSQTQGVKKKTRQRVDTWREEDGTNTKPVNGAAPGEKKQNDRGKRKNSARQGTRITSREKQKSQEEALQDQCFAGQTRRKKKNEI